jgi:hypothetical protein
VKKQIRWQMIQTGLLVALVVVNLPHGPAIDAAHAQNAAIFRLAVTLTALVGIPITWRMTRKAQAEAAATASTALGDVVAEVRYQSTVSSLWRCNLQGLQRPQTIAMLSLIPLVLGAATASTLDDASMILRVFVFVFVSLMSAAGMAAFILLLLWLTIRAMKPSGSGPRIATTTLTRTAVVDTTPEKRNVIAWRDITALRHHKGDLFFWSGSAGCFIPREAFADAKAALLFFETARQLRDESKMTTAARAA